MQSDFLIANRDGQMTVIVRTMRGFSDQLRNKQAGQRFAVSLSRQVLRGGRVPSVVDDAGLVQVFQKGPIVRRSDLARADQTSATWAAPPTRSRLAPSEALLNGRD